MSSVGAIYRSWKSEITPHSIGGTEYPFIVGLIEVEYHNQIPQGCVIDQHPVPGAMAVVDTPVDLTVSLGVEMVSVPDLLGLDQAGAETVLSETSLAVGDITMDYADTVPADRVFDQAPMAGTRVPAGTPVSLSLSLGVWTGVDTEPPRVRLTVTPERIDLGQSVHLTLWVSDNAGVVERTLTIDGTPVPLVGNRLDYTPEHCGGITVTATASDAAGHTAADSITVTVVDPNDTTPPVVDLDEDDCADVTSLYSLTGTIAEEGSFTYQLLFREKGAVDWRVLSEGQGSGSLTGELAVFDPTLLVNGVYEIKLLVEDANGNVDFDTGCALVDGQLKLGPLVLPQADLNVTALGPDLTLARVYDSRLTDAGDFGPGWHLPQRQAKAQVTETLGQAWDQSLGGGFLATYYLVEKKRHVVVIRLSDDKVLKFKMDVTPKVSMLIPFEGHTPCTVGYLPLDTTRGTLQALDAAANVMLIDGQLREYGVDLYNPQRFRYTTPDGTRYIVSSQNGIEGVTDNYGRTLSYDDSGIHHSSGVSLTFERGADNRIEKITGPYGREVTYHYDADGMLEKVVQNTAVSPTFQKYFYGGTRLEAIEAPDGTQLGSFEYDWDGRITAMIDPDGNRVIYGHDLPNNRQEITDRRGNVTVYHYDDRGNVTGKVDPLGHETLWTYDERDNRLTETDPLGHTTAYTYDADNNQLSETDPLGNTTRSTYDAKGNVLTTTDPAGNQTVYTYDDHGNLLTQTDATGNVTSYSYDDDGNMAVKTDALGNVTTYAYDEFGNLILEIDPAGNRTEKTYNAYGDMLSKTVYRTTDTGLVAQTETFAYDILGNKTREIDADGNETRFEYKNHYTSNKQSEKTAQIDPLGNRTEYEYDARGNQTAIHYPDGTSQTTTYDADDNRISTTDRDGRTTTFAYDARGRLSEETRPDGSVISYTYDAVGNRTSLTVASGTTSYTFDELNRLETVTDPDGGVTAYTYDAVGNRASVTYPNGTVAEYTYDALNRLTYLENRKSSGEVISSYAYTLGPAGNRVQVVENNGRTVDYTYDGLYRLVQEDISDAANGAETIAYTYDAFGNRLTKTDGSGTIVYAYDANDRLISETGPAGAYTYAYDANGNTLEKSDGADSIYYTYDSENRLIQVDDGTSITAYTYDADGSRVASDTDGVDTVFVVDKNRQYAQVLEERDGAGSLTVSYVYGDDLISQHRGGSISYYHYDGQLSTRTLTNAAGDITDTYDYDAFGNLRDQVGTTENNYRYTGEQFDPNAGFYYLRARYYDQAMGRFVATDPYQGRMHEPVTLHKYLYANANPVMFNDPSGKFAGSIGSSMTALSIMALMIAATHVAIQTIENAIKYFDIKFVKFPGLRDNNPELYYKLKKIYNELLKKRNN